jgi:hypothetical protein
MERSDVADFVMTMLHSSTVTHLMHLKTKSYSQHVALGDYYEGVVGLVDSFAEAYQGSYGVIEQYPAAHGFKSSPVQYIANLCEYVEEQRKKLPQDSQLQNIVDEIVALLDTTLYKLRRFTEA